VVRNVTTDQFIAVAEQVSGRQLDDLFTTWLFTATRPEPAAAASRAADAMITKGSGAWSDRNPS
jgi:aminopeptidase N